MRESGYYWVKTNNEWQPAEFIDDLWYIILGKWALEYKDMQEIDETQIKRIIQ